MVHEVPPDQWCCPKLDVASAGTSLPPAGAPFRRELYVMLESSNCGGYGKLPGKNLVGDSGLEPLTSTMST